MTKHKVIQKTEQGLEVIEKLLPVERSIALYVNKYELLTIQATPENLDELAVGFLYSEGLLKERDSLKEIQISQNKDSVRVEMASVPEIENLQSNRTITSGCGKGLSFWGIQGAVRKIKSDFKVSAKIIPILMKDLLQKAILYGQTGGIHASALADNKGFLYIREDIARHNTFAKLLGRAFLDDLDTSQTLVLTTGRISSEMAMKAARANIPIVVSHTGATDLAVDLAEELGLTLIGYARAGKMNIYTHPTRVE